MKNLKNSKTLFFPAAIAKTIYRHSIYILRMIIWVVSELESHISEPGDPLLFRKILLISYGIKPPKRLWIGRNFLLFNYNKEIQIGDKCALGDNVTIVNHSQIQIGSGFIGASGLHIDSGGHDPETLQPLNKPIIIGNDVWCGIQTTILAGSIVEDKCVIAAGSVVKSHIKELTVAAGVPAVPKKKISRDNRIKTWTW